MQEDKMRVLFAQTRISSFGAIAGGICAFSVFSWYYFSPWMGLWLVAIISVSLQRLALYRRFLRHKGDYLPWQELWHKHLRTLVVSGVLWGSLTAYPDSHLPPSLASLTLLGPALVLVGALSSYAICTRQYQAFLASVIGTGLVSLTLTRGVEAVPALILYTLLGVLLNALAVRFSNVLEQSMRAKKTHEIAHIELEQANKDLERQRSQNEQEESLARHVFKQLTLSSDDGIPGVRKWNKAMGNLSGDIIQVFRGPKGEIYVYLGDFTGHGLPAALGAVPAASVFRTMVGKGLDVDVIAAELNRKLYSLLPTGYFCCAAILKFSPDRQRLTVWNGGLPPIFICHAKSAELQTISSTNLPLGVVDTKEFQANCTEWNLREDANVLVYSDGLTEAENVQGEMWGKGRLQSFLEEDRVRNGSFLNALKAQIEAFTEFAPASDDISVIEISTSIENAAQNVA